MKYWLQKKRRPSLLLRSQLLRKIQNSRNQSEKCMEMELMTVMLWMPSQMEILGDI